MVVGIGAGDLDALVPVQRMRAGDGGPVKLHEARLPLGVHQAEGVHAEALHGAEASRQRAVGHDPHQHVGRLRHEGDEVPERVVGARGLRHAVVRFRLHGVDQVGELHRVLDEEHGDVVADDVEVALVGVELRGEAADVARGVGRAALARDGREPHEDRGALPFLGQEGGARVLGEGVVALEEAMGRRPAGVHDALGDALVVEVRDLLAEDEVLEKRGPAQPGLERALVVGDGLGEVRGEGLVAGVDADALEGLVAGVEPGAGPAARLWRDGGLAERAAGHRRTGWRRRRARLGVRDAAPISPGLLALNGKAAARAWVPCFLSAAGPFPVPRAGFRTRPVDPFAALVFGELGFPFGMAYLISDG